MGGTYPTQVSLSATCNSKPMQIDSPIKYWKANESDVLYTTNTDDSTGSDAYPAHPTPAGGAHRVSATPSRAPARRRLVGASPTGPVVYVQVLTFANVAAANTWTTAAPVAVLVEASNTAVTAIPPVTFAPFFTAENKTEVTSSASVVAPTPVPSSDSTSSNTGAIVGGVVGGILGAALLGFLIYFFCFREKKSPMTSTGKQVEAEESGFTVANPAASR